MLNKIWTVMLLAAFAAGIATGRIREVSDALMTGAKDAAALCFSLLGIMCLWTGLAKVAEKSGLTDICAAALYPVTKILFPNLKKNSAALNAIVMNIVANLLGMGNAATPLGIKAMKELDKLNLQRDSASDEMCMFAVINTASVQLIPATLIALRETYASQNPGEIILAVWVTSIAVIFVGVSLAKLFALKRR